MKYLSTSNTHSEAPINMRCPFKTSIECFRQVHQHHCVLRQARRVETHSIILVRKGIKYWRQVVEVQHRFQAVCLSTSLRTSTCAESRDKQDYFSSQRQTLLMERSCLGLAPILGDFFNELSCLSCLCIMTSFHRCGHLLSDLTTVDPENQSMGASTDGYFKLSK